MKANAAPTAQEFVTALKSSGKDEAQLNLMLEEACNLLSQEYAQALQSHEEKLEVFKKREAAAELRLAEVGSLTAAMPGSSDSLPSTAANQTTLQQKAETMIARVNATRPNTLELAEQLRLGLDLLEIFDQVEDASAGSAQEEHNLAVIQESLAESLAALHIHEFSLGSDVALDENLHKLTRSEKGHALVGQIVKATLKNGFCVDQPDGHSVCLRKAVVDCTAV
jgi:hypothetical protein